MYIPQIYKNEDLGEVREFIRTNAFGILVNQLDGKPWATHLPLELYEDGDGQAQLVGHISKANPQWRAFEPSAQVLCIFQGPHSYVSSSWYAEEEVPTWDYIAVHVYGTLNLQDDEALYTALDRLVNRYERDVKNPLKMSDFSKKTLRQMRGVVGFSIGVERIEAAYKLSQGRPQDHGNIIRELEATGDGDALSIATAIKKHGKRPPESK